MPSGTPLENIREVEIEVYHVFPLDSANAPSGNVPSRLNSPADVEIDSATRARSSGTLAFSAAVLNAGFSLDNTVVNGINKLPNTVTTNGEGPATGEEVEVTITFTSPIVLPQGRYFLRPEVVVTGGDFLYVSAPRPILSPGNTFVGDLQAWIRNANLAPDFEIAVHGSIQLAQSLLAESLVDQLQLVIGPAFGFGGRRLFELVDDLQRLELLSAKPTPSGSLLLAYRVPR